ncbi:unnamed protein product [Darwinula stevensoni]|uniref:Uncharacterized protein n=1 Tax=Darwinula stevensoni TaxID=69355 RepID=A0A7R8X5I4_9CRUS|nr:unnamed protein product [Darwinula stevensoni]CAG0880156.1 unnamed protein product [Darwinula stevensoni]
MEFLDKMAERTFAFLPFTPGGDMRFNFRLFVPVTVGYQSFGGGGNSDSDQSDAETVEDWPGDTRSRRLGSPRYKRHAKRLSQNQKQPDERKRERDRLREKKRIAEGWEKGTTSPKEEMKKNPEIAIKNNEEKVEEEVGAGGRESPQTTKADEGQTQTRQAQIDRVAQVPDEEKIGEGSGENKAEGKEEKEREMNVTSSEVRGSSKEEVFNQLMRVLQEELSATKIFDETAALMNMEEYARRFQGSSRPLSTYSRPTSSVFIRPSSYLERPSKPPFHSYDRPYDARPSFFTTRPSSSSFDSRPTSTLGSNSFDDIPSSFDISNIRPPPSIDSNAFGIGISRPPSSFDSSILSNSRPPSIFDTGVLSVSRPPSNVDSGILSVNRPQSSVDSGILSVSRPPSSFDSSSSSSSKPPSTSFSSNRPSPSHGFTTQVDNNGRPIASYLIPFDRPSYLVPHGPTQTVTSRPSPAPVIPVERPQLPKPPPTISPLPDPDAEEIAKRLQKLDFFFENLNIPNEQCKQMLMCELAFNETLYEPLSDIFLDEIRHLGDLTRLKTSIGSSNEGVRFMTYMQAAVKGKDNPLPCRPYETKCRQGPEDMINLEALTLWKDISKWLTIKVLSRKAPQGFSGIKRIVEVCQEISATVIQKVRLQWRLRLQLCVRHNGGHFEQIM